MTTEKKLTGLPSIDKPWYKYYSVETINAPLPKMTLYQYAWENNKNNLNDVAFRYFGKKITYKKLFEQIKRAASAFYELGIREGDIVTIMSTHTPETIIAIYGLNYLGAVANIVYMTLSEKEIINTIKNTESKAFLVLETVLEKINRIKDRIAIPIILLTVSASMPLPIKIGYGLKNKIEKNNFTLFKDFIENEMKKVIMSTEHAANALIVYTSGTTGEPKGVVLSNDNINAVVFQYRTSGFHTQRKETFLEMIPPFLAVGFGLGIHMPICLGWDTTLYIIPDFDKIAKEFDRIKPNHFISGPPIVPYIMKHVKGDMKYLINFGGAGESIPIEKEREINAFLKAHGSKAKYVTGYGMSEFASGICTGMNHVYKEGTIGIPLPKSVVKIVDIESGKECQYNQEGEICFSSPCLMQGYYHKEQETSEIIEVSSDGTSWLHTGDMGFVDEEGFVHIVGRIKRIYITTSGKGDTTPNKLFPDRVEKVLGSQNFVKSCGVIAKEDEQRINIPIAFVEITGNSNIEQDQVKSELWKLARKELPAHMVPQEIIVLDKMPLTQSGKIDYKALEKRFKED